MTRCKKGTIGRPIYKVGDSVFFRFRYYGSDVDEVMAGTVEIVDAYGTFDQEEEPSYDIMVSNFRNRGERCLVKHVRESNCYIDK